MCFAVGAPSTSARYSFSTPKRGCVSAFARSPSFVSRSSPSRVAVQPPHREHPRSVLGQERPDVRAALRIAHRRHDSWGLVQGVVPHVGVEVHLETVDPTVILCRVEPIAERRDGPVDGDATLDDQLLARATGAESRPREARAGGARPATVRRYSDGRLGSGSGGLDYVRFVVVPRRSSASTPRSGARDGNEASEGRPSRSRNSGVVANRTGRPGVSSRPASSTSPLSVERAQDPVGVDARIEETWCRVTGCL